MVKYYSSSLDTTFAAISDPTRRAILARLMQGQASVTELAQPFDMSLPAVSKHLGILERAGLLVRQKEGRIHHCRLAATPLKEAVDWLSLYKGYWEGQFEALAQYLDEGESEEDG